MALSESSREEEGDPVRRVVVVFAIVLASCSSGAASTSTTVDPGLRDRFVSALGAELAVELDAAAPGMGECFAATYVDVIGVAALVDAGMTPETTTMDRVDDMLRTLPRRENLRLHADLMPCALMFTAAQYQELGLSPESIECFVQRYEAWIDGQVDALVEDDEWPLWLLDEEAFDALVMQFLEECLTPEELRQIHQGDSA